MTQQASTPDALIERLRGGVYGLTRIALCEEAAAELRRQHAEIGRLRADAARYRMLRPGRYWSVVNGIGDRLHGDKLDSAIDAAMRDAPNA